MVNAFNHTKCKSFTIGNAWLNQPTIINLHPNEYIQEFHYYSFAVKLDTCVESCNTFIDLSNKVWT